MELIYNMQNSILITGHNGEIGRETLLSLSKNETHIIALDINDSEIHYDNVTYIKDTILNQKVITNIFQEHNIIEVYHFAALLSQSANKNPDLANEVNEEGSKLIINTAMISGLKNKSKVKIFFPSSIAVYGPRKLKNARETDIIKPETIYGRNKLAIEQFGTKQHEKSIREGYGIDFRCLRFPGIISPYTIPTGGTTDFAPQMLHAAENNERFTCKVIPTTTLPFLGIKGAINAILKIMYPKKIDSNLRSFNVQEMSLNPTQIIHELKKIFPKFEIDFNKDDNFQSIADTWPESLNCGEARIKWGFQNNLNEKEIFEQYLIPEVKKHYAKN
tara:strand:- start:5555 stop:6550 length:996 start_codon:yes stop_codon:yes gene_type:complete